MGQGQSQRMEGYAEYTPATVPLSVLQTMFTEAGCNRLLKETDVTWWRGRNTINDIKNDMKAYGTLTATGAADFRQANFCLPASTASTTPISESVPGPVSAENTYVTDNGVNQIQNSENLAVLASSLGITNINSFPKQMGNVNATALSLATPMRGTLNLTRVDTTNYDNTSAACAKMSYADIREANITNQVTSTDTGCGWIQFGKNGSGVGILGVNTQPIGPMPTNIPAGSKYYSPLLTTSVKSSDTIWANGVMCTGVGSQTQCITEPFQNIAKVDSNPFVDAMPMPSSSPITRDRHIQVDTNVGTMAATLYQESQKGLSDDSLSTKSSYSIFNKSMENVHGIDADSWQTSFQTFQPVGNDIFPRPSRDIPVIYGNMEQHDFCAEMNEQTIISEDTIGCLQREWIRKGGSPKDADYPTTALIGSCYGRIRR